VKKFLKHALIAEKRKKEKKVDRTEGLGVEERITKQIQILKRILKFSGREYKENRLGCFITGV